jgi:hypothetical protein
VAAQPLVYLFVARVAAQFLAEAFGGDLALVARGVFERITAAARFPLTLRRSGSRP